MNSLLILSILHAVYVAPKSEVGTLLDFYEEQHVEDNLKTNEPNNLVETSPGPGMHHKFPQESDIIRGQVPESEVLADNHPDRRMLWCIT